MFEDFSMFCEDGHLLRFHKTDLSTLKGGLYLFICIKILIITNISFFEETLIVWYLLDSLMFMLLFD